MEVRMADGNSSDPTLNETTDKADSDDTNVNTNVNTTNSGDNSAVEDTSKYGDTPGGGGNQNPESTGRRENTGGATPI